MKQSRVLNVIVCFTFIFSFYGIRSFSYGRETGNTVSSTSQTELEEDDNIENQLAQSHTGSSLSEELDTVEKQLEQNRKKQAEYAASIKAEKANSQSYETEISILENQVNLLNKQIEEKKLVIQQLNIQVEILTKEISDLKDENTIAQDQITTLEKETDGRLLNMYINQKENSSTSTSMFSAQGPSALVKSDTYRQALQQDTNNKLEILRGTREQLEKDKSKLEDDKVTVSRNKTQVDEEKIALDQKKVQADSERQSYIKKLQESKDKQNQYDKILAVLPQEEQELMDKYERLKDQTLSEKEIISGLPIKAGTFIGIEGETGYAYGIHTHFGVSIDGVIKNPCTYLPAGAYGDCGGNGKLQKPLPGAVLTSGFRTPSRPSHNAIDISTGKNDPIYAAQDGYIYYFFEGCKGAPVCNGGGAIVAKICESNKCDSGMSTVYYHMKCTAQPKGTGYSCN